MLLVGRLTSKRHCGPASQDAGLIDLVDELCRTRSSLDAVLRGDDRDASDIPGYTALADRLAVLTDAVCRTPVVGLEGVLAKARAVTPIDAALRADGAVSIAMSIAADLVAVGDGRMRSEHGTLQVAPAPVRQSGGGSG